MSEQTQPAELLPGDEGYDTSPRRVLLLASYCGGDTDGCSDEHPCLDCLKMCNVVTMAGPISDNSGGWDFRDKPAKVMPVTGWLIEAKPSVSVQPMWRGITESGDLDWTHDHEMAIRFARKIDAERVIEVEGWTEAFASKHAWDLRRLS